MKYFASILVVFAMCSPSSAQGLLKKLADKAERKVQQRAEQKVDQAMDKSLDAAERSLEKKSASAKKEEESASTRQADYSNMLSSMGESMDVTYDFDHQVTMVSKMYKKDKLQNEVTYTILIPEDGESMGFVMNLQEDGETMATQSVFDFNEQKMISLVNQQGMKMGMEYSWEGQDMGEDEDQEFEVNATGKSKEILGYTAEEYEITNDESYSRVWVTDELDFRNYYEGFMRISKKETLSAEEMPDGFMLEIHSWPDGRDGKEKMVMTVTDIRKDTPEIINTDGYRIMKMDKQK